jgi:acyl-CoA thioesterase
MRRSNPRTATTRETAFDRDTAVTKRGDGRYEAELSTDWWVVRGPNGGYLAAIVLRALTDAVADPERAPRSLTVHYTSAPGEGAVQLVTSRERVGRSLTTCTCRMEQAGRLVALAVAAFSRPRPGPEFQDVVMPQVPGPEAFAPRPPVRGAPPIARCWETRWAIGHPPVPGAPSGQRAVAGGWIRLPEPHAVDAPVAAAITDGWIPPMFGRVREPVVVPTVDLTVHFRARLPHPGVPADAFVLAAFRTTVAADGFLEEDGEIWAPDGTLLAQSRQLATIMSG